MIKDPIFRAALLISWLTLPPIAAWPGEDEAFALFNGENLDGWHTAYRFPEMDQDLFKVRDGMIHVLGKQADGSEQSFAGLITDDEYSDYVLRLEYRWGDKKFRPRHEFVRDAGVILHVHGEEKIWPYGVECQIQEGDTGDIWAIGTQVTSTVNPVIRNYAPGGPAVTRGGTGEKPFARFHRGYSWETPGWNQLELRVRGDHAVFIVNGHVVNEAIDMKYWNEAEGSWQPLTRGRILLQAEGAEIFYRNISLAPLPD